MKNLGDILDQSISADISLCTCGHTPMLIRRAEGLVNVWRVECKCEKMTGACFSLLQAVAKWETNDSE